MCFVVVCFMGRPKRRATKFHVESRHPRAEIFFLMPNGDKNYDQTKSIIFVDPGSIQTAEREHGEEEEEQQQSWKWARPMTQHAQG